MMTRIRFKLIRWLARENSVIINVDFEDGLAHVNRPALFSRVSGVQIAVTDLSAGERAIFNDCALHVR